MNLKERMDHHYKGGETDYSNKLLFLRKNRLYQSEGCGSLSVFPDMVKVAERKTLSLKYTIGYKGLAESQGLRLFVVGYNSFSFLTEDPAETDHALVQVKLPDGVKVSTEIVNNFNQREVWVRLVGGSLAEGDIVEFVIGSGDTLGISEVARPVAFHVEQIGRGEDEDGGMLVDRAVLHVAPGRMSRLECIVDPEIQAGTPVDVKVLATDRFGNLVENTAVEAEVELGGRERKTLSLLPGDGGFRKFDEVLTAPSEEGFYKIAGSDRISGLKISSNPMRVLGTPPECKLYFGDMHAHDFLSPGIVSPMEYYEHAQMAGYHFVALPLQTQSRNVDQYKWAIACFAAEDHYMPGTFVTFPAIEWQHYAFGHKNIYFQNPDQPYPCPYDEQYDTPEKLFEALRKSDAMCFPHHVGYKLDCHVPGSDWDYVDEEVQPIMEICSCHGSNEKADSERPLNNPGTGGFYQDVLERGVYMGVIGGSDSHSGWPVRSPREPRKYPGGLSCVYAKELTRKGLFEGFRNRRAFATTGARMILEFDINGHPMGEIISVEDLIEIRLAVAGTAPLERVEIIKNNQTLHAESPSGEFAEILFMDKERSGKKEDFYYIKVVQVDGEMAWSSPVWVRNQIP